MTLGREMEYIRVLRKLSIVDVCNAMGISESEYRHIIYHQYRPTTYQLIMFISATCHSLNSI